jgi:hypothetical protein
MVVHPTWERERKRMVAKEAEWGIRSRTIFQHNGIHNQGVKEIAPPGLIRKDAKGCFSVITFMI